MDDNFRQAVEKILSFHSCEFDGRICSDMTLDKYEERPSCERCRLDLIMAEVEKMAEGMPKIHLKTGSDNKAGCMTDCILFNSGADEQYEKCQDYLKEQTK